MYTEDTFEKNAKTDNNSSAFCYKNKLKVFSQGKHVVYKTANFPLSN